MEFANIARAQSWRFFWPGADREDVEQEAMLALVRDKPTTPVHAKTVVTRHLIDQVRKQTLRRPQFSELTDRPSHENVVELAEARDRLRSIGRLSLTPSEQEALSRTARGEGCTDKRLDNALQSLRRKLHTL